MWLDKSVMFPTLHSTIRQVLASTPNIIVQFVLEPLAFPSILADFTSQGEQFSHQLSFLTRTFAFYMHNQYKKNLKAYNDQPNTLTLTNTIYFSAPGDCDRRPSDLVSTTSCTSTVEPHTNTKLTSHDQAVSVRSARNVASHTHYVRFRENVQSEPNHRVNSNQPDLRDLQTVCDPVGGGVGEEWADEGHDRSHHDTVSTTITFHNGHL